MVVFSPLINAALKSIFSKFDKDQINITVTPIGTYRVEFNDFYNSDCWLCKISDVTDIQALSLVNNILKNINPERVSEETSKTLLVSSLGCKSKLARVLKINRGTVRKHLSDNPDFPFAVVVQGKVYLYKGEVDYSQLE